MRFGFGRGSEIFDIGVKRLHMTDGGDRRAVAGAHARRANDAHILPQCARQCGEQLFGAGHRAR